MNEYVCCDYEHYSLVPGGIVVNLMDAASGPHQALHHGGFSEALPL